ncbi:hypothetical protein [Micromonospora sp. NPDC005113]
MERWLQTCRRELLDRTLIWNQRHLLHALKEFNDFYNSHRPSPRHRQRTPVTPVARAGRRPEQTRPPRHTKARPSRRCSPRIQACCVTCTDEIPASAGWWSEGIEGGLAHIFVYNIRSQSRRLEELPSNPFPSETSPRRLRPLRTAVVTVALACTVAACSPVSNSGDGTTSGENQAALQHGRRRLDRRTARRGPRGRGLRRAKGATSRPSRKFSNAAARSTTTTRTSSWRAPRP